MAVIVQRVCVCMRGGRSWLGRKEPKKVFIMNKALYCQTLVVTRVYANLDAHEQCWAINFYYNSIVSDTLILEQYKNDSFSCSLSHTLVHSFFWCFTMSNFTSRFYCIYCFLLRVCLFRASARFLVFLLKNLFQLTLNCFCYPFLLCYAFFVVCYPLDFYMSFSFFIYMCASYMKEWK